jgi:hypothetical protein
VEDLAPIGIGTYSRIDHLKKTIKSLQKNTLAHQSELYIFSDAPKKGDEKLVGYVRDYIRTIDGFKKVHIVERKTNDRIKNNRGGIKQLLAEYGKIIWLEDDNITAPGFLTFMNDALKFYKDDKKILSISGYCPPINIPQNYEKDIFLLQRFSGWGLATWKDKFDPFKFELSNHGIDKFLNNKNEIKRFNQNGEDMFRMLIKEYNNEFDALDVKIMFYQFQCNKFTIYPIKSLVQNIGHDGSGLHCGITDKFYIKSLWNKTNDFEFVKDIQLDERIRKANYEFRSFGSEYLHLSSSLSNYIKDMGVDEVIVYGAGDVGHSLVRALNLKNIKVNCVVDKNELLTGSFIENAEITSLNEAIRKNIDTYVIASFAFREEITSIIEDKYSGIGKKPTIFSFDNIEIN